MNKFRFFALIAALVMILCLCACGGDDAPVSGTDLSGTDVSATDVSDSDADWYAELSDIERAAADVVLSSTDAFNAEDEDAYMATVDPESEALAETLEYIRLVFEKYSLTAEVEEIEVVRMKGSTAELLVTQTTVRNGEGKAFADVRTLLRHSMICRDGVWYISSTVVESRTELDTSWDIAGDYLADQNTSGSDLPAEE